MKRLSVLLVLTVLLSACANAYSMAPTEVVVIPDSVTMHTEANVILEPFGTVAIAGSDIEFNVSGDGENIDSIAFWEAPEATQSLMFVTSKNNPSTEVYQYPFTSQLRTVSCGDAANGVWVDQKNDVLYITQRYSGNVCAYDLPALDKNASLSFTTAATSNQTEPNLTILQMQDGQSRVYVSYDNIVYYHDAGTETDLGQFTPREELEAMYGDDYYQEIYIPDERHPSGIYIYDANGELADAPFGDPSIFQKDAEGISVYKCLSPGGEDRGEGLIVVSDQKGLMTDFEVFSRKSKVHLGTIHINGVNLTDGIAITNQSSPAYPLGLLAVLDDDTSTVGVGWHTILEKTGLSCGS